MKKAVPCHCGYNNSSVQCPGYLSMQRLLRGKRAPRVCNNYFLQFLTLQVSQSPNIGVLRRKIQLHWMTVTNTTQDSLPNFWGGFSRRARKSGKLTVSLSAPHLLQPHDWGIFCPVYSFSFSLVPGLALLAHSPFPGLPLDSFSPRSLPWSPLNEARCSHSFQSPQSCWTACPHLFIPPKGSLVRSKVPTVLLTPLPPAPGRTLNKYLLCEFWMHDGHWRSAGLVYTPRNMKFRRI